MTKEQKQQALITKEPELLGLTLQVSAFSYVEFSIGWMIVPVCHRLYAAVPEPPIITRLRQLPIGWVKAKILIIVIVLALILPLNPGNWPWFLPMSWR